MTDEQLIARAQAGDEKAIVTLYESYKERIYRYLYYRLGDPDAAEDLTTDVFVRVIQGLPGLRVTGSSVQAWIYQIARNLAIDFVRKQVHRNHAGLHENLVDPSQAPDLAAEQSLNVEQLYRALQELTDEQRDVIVLRFINGHSIAEVAQLLRKSESAIKNLQLRGLSALNRRLSPQWVVYD